jgi:hypothetical protein
MFISALQNRTHLSTRGPLLRFISSFTPLALDADAGDPAMILMGNIKENSSGGARKKEGRCSGAAFRGGGAIRNVVEVAVCLTEAESSVRGRT